MFELVYLMSVADMNLFSKFLVYLHAGVTL